MTSRSRAFADELLRARPSEAQPAARRVLARYAGRSVYLARDPRALRLSAAGHMLRSGMTPAETAATLRARFGISDDTARRDVRKAQQSEKTAALARYRPTIA